MQRSGAATRRFYAAFYQWTVRSANPTRRCAGDSLVLRRKQGAAHATHSRTGVRSYSSTSIPNKASEFHETEEQLRSEGVQSIANRPYKSLAAWDHVVRAKAKRSVTLEIAVPGKVLRDKNIRKKAEAFEVQLTVSNFQEGLDNDVLCPVHLKGDYRDVWAIWRRLYQIGHTDEQQSTTAQSARQTDLEPTSHEVQQSSTDGPTDGPDDGHVEGVTSLHGPDDGQVEKVISLPEAFVKPIGKKGTIEYFQTKFGVQAGQPDKYGTYNFMQLKGDTKQVTKVLQFVEELRAYVSRQRRPSVGGRRLAKQPQIIRPTDLRSEDLNYWQSVRRKQLSGRAEEEFCLPEQMWQSMKQDRDVEDLRVQFGIVIKEFGVFDGGKKRCISLNGNVADVDRAKNWLAEFRVTIPEMQEDTEYLKIHAALTSYEMSEDNMPVTDLKAEIASESSSAESALITELDGLEKPHMETDPLSPGMDSQASKDTGLDYWYLGSEVRRYRNPKFLKFGDHDILGEIQIKANLKALRYRQMPKKLYLQAVGTPQALNLAQDLIQDGIDNYNQQHDVRCLSIKELEFKWESRLPQPSHFAVLKLSKRDGMAITARRATLLPICDVKASRLRQIDSAFDVMEVVGTEEAVKLALGELQSVVDQDRSETGRLAVKLEVLHAGTIKATEFDDEIDRADQAALQDLYYAALPRKELPDSYYAWVSVPSDSAIQHKLQALSEKRQGVSFDWKNQVALPWKKNVAIRLEGYRLAVLSAIDAFSRSLYSQSRKTETEPDLAKILRIDLIEFVDEGRDFIDKLCENPANTSSDLGHVSLAKPHEMTAEALEENAQSSGKRPRSFPEHDNATPYNREAPEATASGNVEESVTKAAVVQPPEQWKHKLGNDMRFALRHLSQPVAVVTSMQKDPMLEAKEVSTLARGVTVSSFCTVTLTPVPVISFNLRVPSRSWDAIASSEFLRVHLLKASSEGATVAHAFTQRYRAPHEPFELLAEYHDAEIRHGSTPLINWRAAVQSSFAAKILADKCIQVGDHMIVVAEVRKVSLSKKSNFGHKGALAYGMQGYRQLGGEIEPMQIKATKSKEAGEQAQATASVKPSERKATEIFNKKVSTKTIEDIGPSSPILDQETLQQVLEETETSYATQSLPSQAAAANRMLAEALKAVQDAYRGTSEPAASSSQAQSPAADQSSNATANEGRPADVSTLGKGWGLSDKNASQTRTMSTWARSPYRSYSSRSADPAYPPISKKILKTTVGDYLCQLPAHSKRYANLVNMQRNTERIEAALEQNGKLSPEEVAELEDEVQISRRKISRELAVRNAQDLCAMLDDGRVVMTRVPFLESNLEQGQAALLAEAKLLRDSLERGGLGAADFEKAKAALMKDYEYIDAQLMRLRDMVEDDDFDDDEDR